MREFMSRMSEGLSEQDAKETDGWSGCIVLHNSKSSEEFRFAVQKGRVQEVAHLDGAPTATVHMSDTTFLDLVEAGISGKVEPVFIAKYRQGYITYEGARWLIDSERFRKVFKRLAK